MDKKELAEQWRKVPHGIAEVVEKLIFLELNVLPDRVGIGDNPDEIKFRDELVSYITQAGENLRAAFDLAKNFCEKK